MEIMGIVLLATLFVLIFLNIPICFAIGMSSAITLIFVYNKPLLLIPQRMVMSSNQFALMAIPFFILIGFLMTKTNISKKLINFADELIGHITGGLAMVVVIASMVFAAISGSGPATVAAIGGTTIKEMVKKGYSIKFSTGIAATAGSLGPIIPPSIPMIIYGVVAEESITRLFLGGIGAGVLLGLIMIIICYFKAKNEHIKKREGKPSFKKIRQATWDAKYAISVPIIVLGGIYGGVFTPTEAGAVGSVYLIVIGFFFTRTLNIYKLKEALLSTAENTALIMFIIANAGIFGWLIASGKVPQMVSNSLLSISTNKIILLLLINGLLLIVGALMDTVAAIIILVPVLLPIAVQLNMDPIHFGVIVVVNLVIGYITPPVGYNLYIASSLSGISFEDTSKSVFTFLLGCIVGLLIMTYIPQVVMFVPNLFY
jgi:C4-dicarboxylate transporter, DctM subunit